MMGIQTLAYCETIDTGELELEVTRDTGSDKVTIGAAIFCATVDAHDLMLLATALCNLPAHDARIVVLGDGSEVGLGISSNGASVWISCAPFHMRIGNDAAAMLANALQSAYLGWRGERAREAA
jgi:hypothetical protein